MLFWSSMRHVISPILALALALPVIACSGSEEPAPGSASGASTATPGGPGASKKSPADTKDSPDGVVGDDGAPATTDTKNDRADPDAKPGTGPGAKPEPDGPDAPAGPPKPATEILLEEVYVIMNDSRGGTWYCTGTLVSRDTVVTAGHCLEEGRFRNYQITAPLAEGSPTVAGTRPLPMSNEFDAVENPDLGFLKLKTPIDLPAYAVLTDISKDVENGKPFTAAAVVREREKPISPLHEVNGLAVKSTVPDGYRHGFGVTLFSNGGDSGAGIFLVENGHVTHKMIGVARQPDFDSKTDQLTRIDPDILSWLRTNGAL